MKSAEEALVEGADRRNVNIIGTGSYLPERILTNAELEKMVDTTDEWIRTRTGISERHIASADEAASDMASMAARRAIENAGIQPEEIGMIIIATVTPDMIFPNTACFVQEEIGAKNAFCFDVESACSGFLYAMEIATQFLAGGSVGTALVIGTEKLSTITDWEDRGTCVLFGDGAGAVIMKAGSPDSEPRGVVSSVMGSDGALADLLKVPGGGSRNPSSIESLEQKLHCIKMTGNEVFKHAVRCMCDACNRAIAKCGFSVDDIDCIVPHQANMRIIQAIASRLGCSIDKFHLNLQKVGNMSSASVPVALDDAIQMGRIKKGDRLLFVTFGGGFTWGAMVVEI